MRQGVVVFISIILLITANSAAVEKAHTHLQIVVISLDALHPDALGPGSPAISDLMKKGHFSLNGTSTNPPLTLIAHSAMVTGNTKRQSNGWMPGEPTVDGETIFHWAKAHQMATGLFFSKINIGYLLNPTVDKAAFSEKNAVVHAERFLQAEPHAFAFIHISGLDWQGKKTGWLSPEYMRTLSYLDSRIKKLAAMLESRGKYLLIITSDHAGYGKNHGGGHPDHYKLPIVAISNSCDTSSVDGVKYHVTMLPAVIKNIFMTCGL